MVWHSFYNGIRFVIKKNELGFSQHVLFLILVCILFCVNPAGYGRYHFTPYALKLQEALVQLVNVSVTDQPKKIPKVVPTKVPSFVSYDNIEKNASTTSLEVAREKKELLDNKTYKEVIVDFEGASGMTAEHLATDSVLDSSGQETDVCNSNYLGEFFCQTNQLSTKFYVIHILLCKLSSIIKGLRFAIKRYEYDCCLIMVGTNDLASVDAKKTTVARVVRHAMKLHKVISINSVYNLYTLFALLLIFSQKHHKSCAYFLHYPRTFPTYFMVNYSQVCAVAKVPTLALSVPPNYFYKTDDGYRACWLELNRFVRTKLLIFGPRLKWK